MRLLNRDRLYVCLCAHNGQPSMPGLEDTYRWALLVGPKFETKNRTGIWYQATKKWYGACLLWSFEEKEVTLRPTRMLLIRALVAKVTDRERLNSVLRQVPIPTDDTGSNDISWVRTALENLEADGKALGAHVTAWDTVRDAAMQYCQLKKDEGRFSEENYKPHQAPTYNVIKRKEIVD